MNGESFATDCISDRVCVWQVLTKTAFIMLDQVSYHVCTVYMYTMCVIIRDSIKMLGSFCVKLRLLAR